MTKLAMSRPSPRLTTSAPTTSDPMTTAAPVGTDDSDSAASTGAQAFPALVALAALGASMVL